jgi:hypothetical protein
MTQKPPGTTESGCQPLPLPRTSESAAVRAKSPLKHLATLAAGWFLLLAGVTGLILPVMPGGVLIAAGILVLSPHCSWIRRAQDK